MNNVVKGALIFVGGAAVGGGIGWFVTKKHYEKMMDEQIRIEVAATKEFYQDLVKEEAVEEIVVPENNKIEEAGRRAVESYTDRMNRRKDDLLRPERTRYDRGASGEAERVRYEMFSKPEKKEEEEVDEVRLAQNDDDPRTDIYVINADQFAHERYGFDKVTLYWWELERILSEEDMDILDVPDLLGMNWETHIGEEEKDIVYVRNEPLETDYEVVVQHESFYAMRD